MKTGSMIAAFVFAVLVACKSANAFCLFACTPTEANARSVFEHQFLRSLYHNEKYSISSFQKVSEREQKVPQAVVYTIFANVTVVFPEGANRLCNREEGFSFEKLQAIGNECNSVMAMTNPTFVGYVAPGGSKTFNNLRFDFLKTDKGWRGMDGATY
ncbi:hypothetical protein [Methylocystis sp.]|uniref:hypothetical protein n=1 Tax=Methylocystis sp. TaxID=1911079 RepID=UPI003DA3150C